MKLADKAAIVTGAGQGIGREIALTFAREGADVVVNDISTSKIEKVAEEIKALGRKAIPVQGDVSKPDDVKRIVAAAIDNFGKIDILVNNAATRRSVGLLEMTEEDWDIVMAVNLKGVFLCTQAVAKHMMEQKYGKIISLSSVKGLGVVSPASANYSTSKAGVIQLTKEFAYILGPYNININAMAPGAIVTASTFLRRNPEEAKEFMGERSGRSFLGRTGTDQDVVNLALFLASDDSSFITGQCIATDGGRADRM